MTRRDLQEELESLRRNRPAGYDRLVDGWLDQQEQERASLAAMYDDVARMFREGDRDGLSELSRQTRRDRAERAAEAAQTD